MSLFESFHALPSARREEFARRALSSPETAPEVLASAAQHRLVFLAALDPESGAYNLPWAARLRGALDVDALGVALDAVVLRHEQLSRRFVMSGGGLLSLRSEEGIRLVHLDREDVPPEERDDDARRLAEADAAMPFEVLGGPLLRVTAASYADDDHVLLLTVHHAVADGWSLGVLYQDLAVAYGVALAGDAAPGGADHPAAVGSPAAVGYADYVALELASLTSGQRDAGIRAWGEILAGAPETLALPTTGAGGSGGDDSAGANLIVVVPADVVAGLEELALAQGATGFMAGLAVFAQTLAEASGEADLVIGTPVAGRPSARFDEVVGMFVNTVPIRVRVPSGDSPGELLDVVRDACLESFEHAAVPLDEIVRSLGIRPRGGRAPLFQTAFGFVPREEAVNGPDLVGTVATPIIPTGLTAKFELSMSVEEQRDGSWEATLEYASARLSSADAAEIAAAFGRTAARLAGRAGEGGLGSERAGIAAPEPHSLFELVARAAERNPHAVAVEFEGEELDYARLIIEAESLARVLVARGVSPRTRVGVLHERGPRLIISLLAVLRAGAAYIALDPAYPRERLRFMVEDSRAGFVLGDEELILGIAGGIEAVVVADPGVPLVAASPTTDVALPDLSAATPSEGAYVIYTSGSTGVPKGVSISHRGVLSMVEASYRVLGREAFDAVLALTSVCFDISVLEIFPTLGAGGRLRLVRSVFDIPRGLPPAPHSFLVSVPSMLIAGLDHGTLDVTGATVGAGGEALLPAVVERLYAAGAERVFNLYGPSEDSTYSTYAFVPRGTERPLIGSAIPGGRVYLLDEDGETVADGGTGEICLAGDGLADGYLFRPALTAGRFLPDPFGPPGSRLYRTGDLARRSDGGGLEYLGRIDRQVKVNGVRVELGEVENALLGLPGIEACTAIVRDAPGGSRLSALVTSREAVEAKAVRRALRDSVPAHLIPSVVLDVAEIPRLPNGKVDDKAVRAILADHEDRLSAGRGGRP